MDLALRSEEAVFEELRQLCGSPGYAHVLAFLCFRDNYVGYGAELTSEDLLEMHRPGRLIRSELSTLFGLLMSAETSFEVPETSHFQQLVDQTEELLEELHRCIASPMTQALFNLSAGSDADRSLASGSILREPIFYSGDSAYHFQYRDLSPLKYKGDESWLIENRGFSMNQALTVAESIHSLQLLRLTELRLEVIESPPNKWTVLPWFSFTATELAEKTGLELRVVKDILDAFSVSEGERNKTFKGLNDFNVTNASPILKRTADEFVLFQPYSLYEAMYESPYYWLLGDKTYKDQASINRGAFTKEFSATCLLRVFGPERVHKNVKILDDAGNVKGEIDVLVVFGDRAVVLQAKSKRLTLEARKGNEGVIRSDFRKSIQDSYNQGSDCANLLLQGTFTFNNAQGEQIILPRLKQVYLLCVVSDHYPALSFQAREFLETTQSNQVSVPFVMDIFALDVITEMLSSPLQFLSYVDRRTRYAERISSGHEIGVLAYHLRKNLWLSGEFDRILIGEDVSTSLDLAMLVRRTGIAGQRTPPGVLAAQKGTPFERLIVQIEHQAKPEFIELGFLLLQMSGESASQLNQGIDQILRLARSDHKHHDFTLGTFDTGITVHCNCLPVHEAFDQLTDHVDLRKYKERVNTWFGIKLDPKRGFLEFGYNADYEWRKDTDMDEAAQSLSGLEGARFRDGVLRRVKTGRNDPCPCRSGKKYKKCHGR